MKFKRLLGSAILSFSLLTALAQAPQNLRFNKNGEFKIVQFTDMHLGHDMAKNQLVSDMISEVMESEKPDFVVFTGDNTTLPEVQQTWNQIAAKIAAYKTPWTAVLGNHDDEHGVSRKEIETIIRQEPYCMMRQPAEGIKGVCNHTLPLYASSRKDSVSALLYCFDTNAYSEIKKVKGYGWIDQSQVNWYRNESQRYTQQNGGQPLPALAFFHIPLPEYRQAWESFANRRIGERNEKECSPEMNSGLFVNMLECGDVMGTFVGHDHINSYIACLYNIALAYGRASGGHNTYGYPNPGSRIIVLKEGKREFDTWIREKGNPQRLNECSYPDSFEVKK